MMSPTCIKHWRVIFCSSHRLLWKEKLSKRTPRVKVEESILQLILLSLLLAMHYPPSQPRSRRERRSPGNEVSPFLIFEQSFPSGPYARTGHDDALYATSPNGYMDTELFMKWIDKLFIPKTRHLPHPLRHLPHPLLLILDGHGSHMDIEMIDLLVANDIHLFCLPPHTTNILQPLDVAIFRPLKTYFSRLTDMVKLASLDTKNPVNVCKKNFTAIFKESYEEAVTIGTIKKGFRKCGIFPYNPEAIDKKRLMPDNSTFNISASSVETTAPLEDIDMTVEVSKPVLNTTSGNVDGTTTNPTNEQTSNSTVMQLNH